MTYRKILDIEKEFIYRKIDTCNNDTKLKSNVLLFVLHNAQAPCMDSFMFVNTVH